MSLGAPHDQGCECWRCESRRKEMSCQGIDSVDTRHVQTTISHGTDGPSKKAESTNKSDVPTVDSGQSGLEERQKIADLLGVPVEQVHRLEWGPEPDPGGKGMSSRELKTRFGL